MEPVMGYFKIERNIVGLTLQELESKLGFRPGRLADGARVLALMHQPMVGQFAFAGSTRYSDAEGLVPLEQRRNFPVPHAWLGQRLVKVAPNLRHTADELYPRATVPVEQWKLLVPGTPQEISQLRGVAAYWPRR